MIMLKIISKNVVKEGKVDKFKNLAKELVNESLKEEGCISYSLNEDINKSDSIFLSNSIEEMKEKIYSILNKNMLYVPLSMIKTF